MELCSIYCICPILNVLVKVSPLLVFRLHSLLWTAHGMGGDSFPSGLLVGGADGGIITLWNADSIIK